MNFKDSYQKDMNDIQLTSEFKSQLAEKMKAEATEKKKPQIRRIPAWAYGACAAAVLLLVVGISQFGIQDNSKDIVQNADVVESEQTGNSFNVAKWYQDAKTDEEKFEVFCGLMKQDSDNPVEKIYVSATEDFAEENLLPDEDMSALLTNLQNAKAVSDTPSGDATHYMAVSTDGTIVKFSVYGEKYVSINDIGTTYSF